MDGAKAFRLYSALEVNAKLRGVGVCVVTLEAYPVKGRGGGNSTDLERSSD